MGQARCEFFEDRMYNFDGTHESDPSFNSTLVATLKKTCDNTPSTLNNRVFLDQGTPFVVDNDYYTMLMRNEGILQSDQDLLSSPLTQSFVKTLAAGSQSLFYNQFEPALIKMGNLGPLTVPNGNIRKMCSKLN